MIEIDDPESNGYRPNLKSIGEGDKVKKNLRNPEDPTETEEVDAEIVKASETDDGTRIIVEHYESPWEGRS